MWWNKLYYLYKDYCGGIIFICFNWFFLFPWVCTIWVLLAFENNNNKKKKTDFLHGCFSFAKILYNRWGTKYVPNQSLCWVLCVKQWIQSFFKQIAKTDQSAQMSRLIWICCVFAQMKMSKLTKLVAILNLLDFSVRSWTENLNQCGFIGPSPLNQNDVED